MPRRKIQPLLLVAVAAMLCASCGSSSPTGTLTRAQAQAVSQQVAQAAAESLSGVQGSSQASREQFRGRLSAALADLNPEQSSSLCTPTANGQSCNFPLSASDPCSGGGSVSVTGDVQGTLNNSGAGSLAAQLTITGTVCGQSVSGTC